MLMAIIKIILCISIIAMIMVGRKLLYARQEGEVSKKNQQKNKNLTAISFVGAIVLAILFMATLFINMNPSCMSIMLAFTLSICFIGKYFPKYPDRYSIGLIFTCLTIFFIIMTQ